MPTKPIIDEMLYLTIRDSITRATRITEQMALAGLTKQDLESGKAPYDALIELLQDGIDKINRLKEHTHKWDDNCFCMICGADGNA